MTTHLLRGLSKAGYWVAFCGSRMGIGPNDLQTDLNAPPDVLLFTICEPDTTCTACKSALDTVTGRYRFDSDGVRTAQAKHLAKLEQELAAAIKERDEAHAMTTQWRSRFEVLIGKVEDTDDYMVALDVVHEFAKLLELKHEPGF